MKRLILLLSILLLVGGAGAALGDAPSPEPQPSVTTSTTTTPTTAEPPPVVKVQPWKPPLVLKPGDLVRVGNTAEVCGVIQYPTYKAMLSTTITKTPIIGIFCWTTTKEGTPTPGSHVNLIMAWAGTIAPGTAKLSGGKFTDLHFFPSGEWPKVSGDSQLSEAQRRGKVIGTTRDQTWRVRNAPIGCFWDGPTKFSNGKKVMIAGCGGGRAQTPSASLIDFREPWDEKAVVIDRFDPACKCLGTIGGDPEGYANP